MTNDPERSPPVGTATSNRSEPVGTGRSPPITKALGARLLKPPRDPDAEAAGVVRWMQDHQYLGDVGWNALPGDPRNAGILDYYREYCLEEHRTPVRPITLARALGRLAKRGVIAKRQVPVGGRELTTYHIFDSVDNYWLNEEGDHGHTSPSH